MPPIRPLSTISKRNYQALLAAAASDRICLMSCYDSTIDKPATLICAVNVHPDAYEPYEFVPLAMLCEDDPYARFIPPLSTTEACHDE